MKTIKKDIYDPISKDFNNHIYNLCNEVKNIAK